MTKCEFHTKTIEFLGYILSEKGISMAQDKIQSVLEWETPKSVKDVQSFIRFANFYRRFIKDFSKLTTPLTNTLKKEISFSWSNTCQEAFKSLKNRFVEAPILHHFDPSLQPIMETDASDFAIGAILSQRFPEDDKLHPTAFMFRKMQPAEINYKVHDKELLAIVVAFKEWKRYLEGAQHQVLIYTDHKNLEYFATTKTLNRRQARWAQELAAYDFKIVYRPCPQNGKADALSRRSEYAPLRGDSGSEFQPIHTVLKPGQLEMPQEAIVCSAIQIKRLSVEKFVPQFLDKVRSLTENDETYQEQLGNVRKGKTEKGLSEENGLLYYKGRLWIPNDQDFR